MLDIANCERAEFVMALNEGETAGTRIETWPARVRALMDQHVSRWIEENKETRTMRAMTVAAPRHHGVQACVLILHHTGRTNIVLHGVKPEGASQGDDGVTDQDGAL